MKALYTFLFLMAITVSVNAQLTKTFTFEADDAAATWVIFANGAAMTAEDIVVVPNPDIKEPNTSENVLQFSVYADADPWVGMFTTELEEPMVITEDAHTFTLMVYKSTISPMIVKLEESKDGGAVQETKLENTLIDEWELMTFDLTAAIGFSYTKLVVFPDFPAARTDASIVFLDNISSPGAIEPISAKRISNKSLKLYPNPAENVLNIQHPDMTSYTIMNLSGQIIETSKFQAVSNKSIELNNMKSGVYIISVKSGRGNVMSRFIKK